MTYANEDISMLTKNKSEINQMDASKDTCFSVKPRYKRRTVGPGSVGLITFSGEMPIQEIPVILNADLLKAHFHLTLQDAAKELGVCATAIKK